MADVHDLVTNQLAAAFARARANGQPELTPLLDQLEQLVAAGGKRLRPRFCALGYRAGGGTDDAAIARVGASLELLHAFALIQDDVMDGGKQRRGRPTAQEAFTPTGDRRAVRYGISAAILTGLSGFVMADECFYGAPFPTDDLERARAHWDTMRLDALAGQFLDVGASLTPPDQPIARRIGALKSGSYTIVGPLTIGAALASPDETNIDILRRFGGPLGEAFQLRDDIVSTFGIDTGKDRDGDIREGKCTVLIEAARAVAGDSDIDFLDTWVGNPDVGPDEADRVRNILETSGAREVTEAAIAELVAQAKGALEAAPFPADVIESLTEMAIGIAS